MMPLPSHRAQMTRRPSADNGASLVNAPPPHLRTGTTATTAAAASHAPLDEKVLQQPPHHRAKRIDRTAATVRTPDAILYRSRTPRGGSRRESADVHAVVAGSPQSRSGNFSTATVNSQSSPSFVSPDASVKRKPQQVMVPATTQTRGQLITHPMASSLTEGQRPARSRSAGLTVSTIRSRISVSPLYPDFICSAELYLPTLSSTKAVAVPAAATPHTAGSNRGSAPRVHRHAAPTANGAVSGSAERRGSVGPTRASATPRASLQTVDDMAQLTPVDVLASEPRAVTTTTGAAAAAAAGPGTSRTVWGGIPTSLHPVYERAQSAAVSPGCRLSGATFACAPAEKLPSATTAGSTPAQPTTPQRSKATSSRLHPPSRSVASPRELRRRSLSGGPTGHGVTVPLLSFHTLRQPYQRGNSASQVPRGPHARNQSVTTAGNVAAASSLEVQVAESTADVVDAAAPSQDPVRQSEGRLSNDFLSHAFLAFDEASAMDSDPASLNLGATAAAAAATAQGNWPSRVQRGNSTPRAYSPRLETSAFAYSPVSRALRGNTETSASTTPRLSASTPRFTVATNTTSLPYTARMSREGTPMTGSLSPSALTSAAVNGLDETTTPRTPRQRSPSPSTAPPRAAASAAAGGAQETDMKSDSQDYVAAVAEQVSRHFYVILTALDIGRGAALQAEPPVALCLRSMVVDLNTVASLLSYDTRNGIQDLLFEDCAFTTMDLSWLSRLRCLIALRFRGPRTTTTMVNRLLACAPSVVTLTLMNTSRITSLAAIAAAASRVQTLQLIQTDFTASAYAGIVNSRTLRHVMLLQVHLRTNIFDLLNTNHLLELHLVGCPEIYYDGLPEAEWVSSCSPRMEALQIVVSTPEKTERAKKPSNSSAGRGRGSAAKLRKSQQQPPLQHAPQHPPPDFPLRKLVVADCPALQLSKVPFADFRHLEEVSVMYQRGVRAADLAGVLEQGKLTTLRLQGAFVDAVLIQQLRSCTSLQELNLSFCRGMHGMEATWPALADSLRVLHVSYSDIDDDGLAGLDECKVLCSVYARGCMQLRSFDAFRRLSSSVRVLDLTDCSGLENDAFSEPFACTGVHRLVLRGCVKVRAVAGIRSLRMLEELDLAYTDVDDTTFAALALDSDSVALQSLAKLDLSGCRRIDQLADFAAASSTALRNVSSFNLSRSGVSDAGVANLARAVRGGDGCLSELDVSHCASVSQLGPLGAVKTLQTLDASFSAVDDAGLEAFVAASVAAFSRELRVLNVCGCTSLSNVGCLGQLPRLAALNLAGTTVDGTASFVALADCTGLQELDLSECMHVTSVAALVPRLTKLRALNLSLTGIHDDSVAALGSLVELEVLQLSGCPGVVSVDSLASLPALRRLNLSATGIVDVTPLASCPQLWDLSVSSCACLTSLQPLAHSRTLQRLDASSTSVTSESFGTEWMCASLEELDVHGCRELHSMAPGALRHLVSLRRVKASDAGLDNSGVAALAECVGLCEVQLSGCPITSLGLLGVVPTLQCVSAQHTGVDDEGIAGLEMSDSLSALDLTGCSALRDVSSLRSVCSLTTLTLRDSGVSDASFAHGWEQSSVHELNLCGCLSIHDPVMLNTLQGLEVLCASGSGLSDAGLKHVAACPALRWLSVADCSGLTDLSPLALVNGLTHVDASNTPITALAPQEEHGGSAESLLGWSEASRLRHIALRGCASIRDVSALRRLRELYSADFTGSGITATSFAESWASCASLEEAVLTDCAALHSVAGLWLAPHLMQLHLTRTAVDAVDRAEACTSLEVLEVSECKRLKSVRTVRALPRLQRLQCRESEITDDSFREPWTAPNLLEANFSGCLQVRDVGALGSLPRLRSASFAGTFVVDGAIRELSAAPMLEELDLRECSRLAHLSSLAYLPRIRALYLSRTCIDNFTFTSVSRCRRLEVLEVEDCPYLTNVFVVFEFGQLRCLKLPPLSRMVGSVLHTCHNLECLSLHGCPESFEIDSLAVLPRLRVLDLRESAIKTSVLAALDHCPFLEEVDVSYCTNLTTFEAMGSLPRLRCFLAAGLPIADDACTKLTQYPLLEKIVLAECCQLRDVSAFAALPQLHHLDISESGATEESFVGIRHMRALEELSVHGCTAIRSCRLLVSPPEEGEAEEGEKKVAMSVSSGTPVYLPRLKLVDLSGTGIVAAAAAADIAALRQQCPLLTKVYLTGSRAGSAPAPSTWSNIWPKLTGTS